jgi:hypothetical protein
MVGVLIWIGLAIAPLVVGIFIAVIPYVIGAAFCSIILLVIFKEPIWGFVGLILGLILVHKMKRHKD